MSRTDYEDRPLAPRQAGSTTPWWIAALVAIVAIVAVAIVMLGKGQNDQQSAYNQGVSQATTNDANQQAMSAAAQANASANAANASAVQAQTQAAQRNQQNEDNPATQPQTPTGVNSAAPPGVTSNASSPPQ